MSSIQQMITFVLLAVVVNSHANSNFERKTNVAIPRSLSEELIAGFEPQTTVTDHNAIDLDQNAMEEELGQKTAASFAKARRIYQEGGFSKAYAVLTIEGGVPVQVTSGDGISGVNDANQAVYGTALYDTPMGNETIRVQYAVSDKQASYSECQVGGLSAPNLSGCFAATGTLIINGNQATYSYDPATQNDNARTLQYFSVTADEKMRVNGIGSYFQDFQKFSDYYGRFDYANAIITAAFDQRSVNLEGKTFDFSTYDFSGRAEVIKKGSAFMSTAMYVIRELEDALDDCERQCGSDCNDDAVHALDEAVAFYTGSLEGKDGSGDGVQVYALADKRCKDLKTCGPDGDALTGTSKVNIDLFKEFDRMQQDLLTDQCVAARQDKENAVKKMWIPMIQGTLRYAYILATQFQSDDKAEAEGVTFMASVVPMIAHCNSNDAQVIFNNMRPKSGIPVDFSAVKKAFENNYECLGITCSDVGGIYNDADEKYFDGAAPCGKGSNTNVTVLLGVGLPIVALVSIGGVLLFMKRKTSSEVEFKSDSTVGSQV